MIPGGGGRASDASRSNLFSGPSWRPAGCCWGGGVADDSIVPRERGARATNGREIESMPHRKRPTLTETDVGFGA